MAFSAALDRLPLGSPICSQDVQRLANYELLRRLGSGGMAEVWMARMVAGDQITKAVALKLLTAPRVNDERYRRMFVDEARLSMLLGHSNIVQVFDAGSQQGVAYLAMEWVDGLNLDQLTRLARDRRLPFPPALAAHIVGEILQALAYAHTVTRDGEILGLIHRDVSPQNVLISVSGEVKLADFGIARLAREETSGLFLKGKLRYMPPEQICGVSNAVTVDLYAVGAIFHELLDGVRFRDGDDDPAIYAQIQSCGIPELRRRNVPPELDALRRSLLEPDPANRLGSAIEGLELLRKWSGYRNESLVLARLSRLCLGVTAPRSGVEDEDPGAVPAPILPSGTAAREQSPPVKRRLWPALVLGGGALAVFLAIGVQAVNRGDDTGAGTGEVGQNAAIGPAAPSLPVVGEVEAVKGAAEGAADPKAVTVSAERAAIAPDVAPRDALEVTTAGAPAQAAENGESEGDSGVVEPEAAVATNGATRKTTTRKTKKSPGLQSQVHFKTGDFPFVYVRVRGGTVDRELVLEPVKTIDLSPGRYRVEYREAKEDPWTDAGQIRIQGGRSYEAKMSPSGVRLSSKG